MSDQDHDQEHPAKDRTAKTLEERVRPIQERARQMGFVSDGSDDKAFMDEAWGEDGGDVEGWDLEALRARNAAKS